MFNKKEWIEKIKTNEKAMNRINKAIAKEREMKDGYLEVTTSIIRKMVTSEEETYIIFNNFDTEKFFTECINQMIG